MGFSYIIIDIIILIINFIFITLGYIGTMHSGTQNIKYKKRKEHKLGNYKTTRRSDILGSLR